MGIREDALALADDVESTIGGCYDCLLDKRGLCKAESDFDCNDEVCKFVAHRLRAIAEKDTENVTTVSAYDLLPDEDRKAIAWVREQGGLDHVRAEWHSRVPYDLYERRRQRLLGHIAECETALGRRWRRIEELGQRVSDLTNESAELRKRAMPQGYEWDGSVLKIWTAENVDYDGETLFVLIGGRDE